ncbi:hypothetical protein SAMN05421770_101234 [Granulicella rosea]|uniref:Uncharacterized protein n=1 Tax=Granulicella rosea TaxID=474952 RepID=A0A239D3F0_9BACT|nr:hypothetical protein SAMN05421770_101234 [Granulicella rosea]
MHDVLVAASFLAMIVVPSFVSLRTAPTDDAQ